ncbi:MAG: S53 family peptidase [Candidatus Dormibacteria bacterium]
MRIGRAACLTAVAALATYTAATAAVASAAAMGASADSAPVCPGPVAQGVARCSAIQLLNPLVNWHGVHTAPPARQPGHKPGGGGGTTAPAGYYPQDLWSAYGLGSSSTPPSGGTGRTVAVVDAYNDPHAASDLAVYRSQMGLPVLCGTVPRGTSCSGTFTQLDQSGGTSYPHGSKSWSEEISLDLDMISAICPKCSILLVEASSASFSNLSAAEGTALAGTGVDSVSNSYGGSEFSGETAYNSAYDSTSAAITVSAGDSGYGVEFPAAAPSVVAVGGTTLTGASATSRGSQTVWSGTGSGCSAWEANPGWQPVTSLCTSRTVADVSADANPSTGVAVYDTYGESGWLVFGGTSVASPIVASVFALAGYSGSSMAAAQGLYTNEAALTKITKGSNSSGCTVYLCNAADYLTASGTTSNPDPGYNGPTGNGTPNGLTGF